MSDTGPVAPARRSHLLIRLWRGEDRLWKAWWLVGVIGGWLFDTVILNLILFRLLPAIPGVILILIYAGYAGISIWRCSFNVERRFWGHIARAILIVTLIYLSAQIADLLLLR